MPLLHLQELFFSDDESRAETPVANRKTGGGGTAGDKSASSATTNKAGRKSTALAQLYTIIGRGWFPTQFRTLNNAIVHACGCTFELDSAPVSRSATEECGLDLGSSSEYRDQLSEIYNPHFVDAAIAHAEIKGIPLSSERLSDWIVEATKSTTELKELGYQPHDVMAAFDEACFLGKAQVTFEVLVPLLGIAVPVTIQERLIEMGFEIEAISVVASQIHKQGNILRIETMIEQLQAQATKASGNTTSVVQKEPFKFGQSKQSRFEFARPSQQSSSPPKLDGGQKSPFEFGPAARSTSYNFGKPRQGSAFDFGKVDQKTGWSSASGEDNSGGRLGHTAFSFSPGTRSVSEPVTFQPTPTATRDRSMTSVDLRCKLSDMGFAPTNIDTVISSMEAAEMELSVDAAVSLMPETEQSTPPTTSGTSTVENILDIKDKVGFDASHILLEAGFLVQTARYIQERLPTLADYCVICDQSHTFGTSGPMPTCCARNVCTYAFTELKVGREAADGVAATTEVLDLLVSMSIAAANSHDPTKTLKPYPTVEDRDVPGNGPPLPLAPPAYDL